MSALYEGLAEILEIDQAEISPDLVLADHSWDSLAIVSTIALADEIHNVMLEGQALLKCQTVADIEKLIAQKQG